MLGCLCPLHPGTDPLGHRTFPPQNKFEVYGLGEYLHSDDTTFNDPYYEQCDDEDGRHRPGRRGDGLSFQRLLVGARAISCSARQRCIRKGPDGTDIIPTQTAFLQTGRLNLDYNMINRRLTPVLTAGIGYQYLEIDSEADLSRPRLLRFVV